MCIVVLFTIESSLSYLQQVIKEVQKSHRSSLGKHTSTLLMYGVFFRQMPPVASSDWRLGHDLLVIKPSRVTRKHFWMQKAQKNKRTKVLVAREKGGDTVSYFWSLGRVTEHEEESAEQYGRGNWRSFSRYEGPPFNADSAETMQETAKATFQSRQAQINLRNYLQLRIIPCFHKSTLQSEIMLC